MRRDSYDKTVRTLLPERPADGHKGTFGHVFVIAGSRGFTGAAKLTALGAARSGVGLVTVGIPASLGDVVAAGLLEPMSRPLPSMDAETLAHEALAPALEFAASKQAVVLGPGLGQHPETQRFVLGFAARCPVPLLIDADGLNALAGNVAVLKDAAARRVLTPHPGEMARLMGSDTADVQRDRERVASDFAKRNVCTVVLKGRGTVIAARDGDVRVNTTGNSGLATGGTGDVLSGLIGGLMAQGMSDFDAATLGTYIHGLAGDQAAVRLTQRGMIAGDVLDAIPAAWALLENEGSV